MVHHEQEAEGLFEGKLKILKLVGNFCYCPEEDLHISCLLSEAALAYFQLTRLLMGLSKGLAGPHLFSPGKCVSVSLSAGFLLSYSKVWGKKRKEYESVLYSIMCMDKKRSKTTFIQGLFLHECLQSTWIWRTLHFSWLLFRPMEPMDPWRGSCITCVIAWAHTQTHSSAIVRRLL